MGAKGMKVTAPNKKEKTFLFDLSDSGGMVSGKASTQQSVQNFIDNNQLSKEDNRKLDNNRYKIQRYINNNFTDEFNM